MLHSQYEVNIFLARIETIIINQGSHNTVSFCIDYNSLSTFHRFTHDFLHLHIKRNPPEILLRARIHCLPSFIAPPPIFFVVGVSIRQSSSPHKKIPPSNVIRASLRICIKIAFRLLPPPPYYYLSTPPSLPPRNP